MNNSTSALDLASFGQSPPYIFITELTLGVIGTFGNMLVIIVVLITPQMRTTTNYLILNLAIADFFTSFLLIFNKYLTQAYSLPVPSGLAGELYCRLYFSAYFFWINIKASTFNLLLVTFERYFAIARPLTYNMYYTTRSLVIQVIVAWLSSVLLEMTFIFFHRGGDGVCILFDYPSVQVGRFFGVFYFVVGYFIPTVAMVWAYSRILASLHISPSHMNNMEDKRTKTLRMARKRLIKMLLIVLIAYFICWTPDSLLFLVHNLGGPTDYYSDYFHIIILLAFANSILNPFIYAFKYTQFQRGFINNFCRCFPTLKNKVGPDPTYVNTISQATTHNG
ncbi:tachykinin-like peptides receptor 99D [Saccoglossus kowalevskii]